ncbi:Rab-like protein 2A [Sciurus carolinensis]|uniref:Rab-like protein 2A n=1 Tax=Sciurus carolinensis TaxID=30640 RepID=A0AA41MHT5_SCICA|nr:Rab-like protein 2A [Sciurus carolinensis]
MEEVPSIPNQKWLYLELHYPQLDKLNSINQPQQLSTYALTLYKHTATVDGKTILVDFWDTAGQERFQSMHASYYHKAHACIMLLPSSQPPLMFVIIFALYPECTQHSAHSGTWILCCAHASANGERSKYCCRSLAAGCTVGRELSPPALWWSAETLTHQNTLLYPLQVFDVQRKVTYKNLSTWYAELREFRPEIPCIVVANKIDADINVTQKNFNFARKFSLPLYFVSAADGTNVVKLFNDAIRLAVSYKQNSQDFMDEVLQELENFKLEQKEEDAPSQEQSGRTKSPLPP